MAKGNIKNIPFVQYHKALRFLTLRKPNGDRVRLSAYHKDMLMLMSEMPKFYMSLSSMAFTLEWSLSLVKKIIGELQLPVHETGVPLIRVSKFKDQNNQTRNLYEVFPECDALVVWSNRLFDSKKGREERERWSEEWAIERGVNAKQANKAVVYEDKGGRSPENQRVGRQKTTNKNKENKNKENTNTKVNDRKKSSRKNGGNDINDGFDQRNGKQREPTLQEYQKKKPIENVHKKSVEEFDERELKLFRALVEYKPRHGEPIPLREAYFWLKRYGYKNVVVAFEMFLQSRKNPRNVGAYLCKMIKDNVKPAISNYDRNRRLVVDYNKDDNILHMMKVKRDYLFVNGSELNFRLNHREFEMKFSNAVLR